MKMEKSARPSVWSREKINQLIGMYKKNECLWNHFHESYKSKEKRNRAIEEICTVLRITKFEFGKKIHNLRNQFNTEMKKLEQRMEEAGADTMDDTTMSCKWSHFNALMFLRHVIEPRPGGYQTTFQPKKMRLRFDYNSAEDDVDVTVVSANNAGVINNDQIQYQYDENTDVEEVHNEDFQSYENELTEVVAQRTSTVPEESLDQKYQPSSKQMMTQQQVPNSTRSFVHPNTRISQTLQPLQATPQSNVTTHTEIINLSNDNSSTIELSSNNLTIVSANPAVITSSTAAMPKAVSTSTSTSNTNTLHSPLISSAASLTSHANATTSSAPVRDQWDAFGELVASEFRNLNSDISRKKLKRKIMQAMLEVGEEDDCLGNY